jgi:hypothetical protein
MASEEQLLAFARRVETAVDQASNTIGNQGHLWKEFSGDLAHVQFPAPIGAKLPDGLDLQGEPLTLSARDWHGRGDDKLAFWLKTPTRPGWEMPCISALVSKYEPTIEACIGNDLIDPELFIEFTLSYLSLLPQLQAYLATHGLARTFRRGIQHIAKSGIANESITRTTGCKRLTNHASYNGYQLDAYVINTTDKEGKVVKEVGVEVQNFFKENDTDLPFGGRLLKMLEVTIADDAVTESKRASEVSFMDNPFVQDDKLNAFSDGSAADEDEVPDRLKKHLFNDDIIDESDIVTFIDLITKPITEADVTI